MKKHIVIYILLVCIVISLASCTKNREIPTQAPTQAPETPTDQDEKLPLNIIDDNYRNIYEIYVESFFDSDGDGMGDVSGITQKLDYIKNMGYDTVHLSQLYETGNLCVLKEGVADTESVTELIKSARKVGLDVIADIDATVVESSEDALTGVLTYWLSDLGFDGLNFTRAAEYSTSGAEIDHDGNIEFLSLVNRKAREIKSDCYLSCDVAVFDNETVAKYYGSGFDSIRIFSSADATGAVAGCLKRHNGEELADLLVELHETFKGNITTTYIGGATVSNRPATYMSGLENVKMLAGIQMIMGGSVSTYYGDEIAMVSNDGNLLNMMRWNKNVGEAADYYYAPADTQMNDDNSVYTFYAEMLYLRNALPSIARGEVKKIELTKNRAVCLIQKTYNGETVTILLNLASPTDPTDASTGARQIELDKEILGYEKMAGQVCAYGSSYTASYDEETQMLIMPPYSIVVFK